MGVAKIAQTKRDVNGILLFDKPRGMTSNRALQMVKRLLMARKAGHTGSLDPLASGLLPLCFGEATKVSQFLLNADKRYWVVIRLGQRTDTYDAEGEVLETRPVNISREQLAQALEAFKGEIEQVPPMYSAIKQAGQPLYKLARAGLEIERASRQVVIRELHSLAWQDEHLELEILCSKGTYIRSLANDLGERLGCGAHVTALRRLGTGAFQIDEAISLETLEGITEPAERSALLIPEDRAIQQLPAVILSSNAAFYLCRGQSVTGGLAHRPGWVRLYEAGGRFLGVGEVLADGRVAPKRLLRQLEVSERSDITKEIG